jgi:ketosteroid isomerase-like protein
VRRAALIACALASGCAHVDARALCADYATAWNARSVIDLAEGYSDSAVLEPVEGGRSRAGRADIAGYLRAVFAGAGDATMTLVEAKAAEAPDRLVCRFAFEGPRTFQATAEAQVGRGVVRRWERVKETWTAATTGAELGAACAKDLECRGFARCDEGRCEVAPKTPSPGAVPPPR